MSAVVDFLGSRAVVRPARQPRQILADICTAVHHQDVATVRVSAATASIWELDAAMHALVLQVCSLALSPDPDPGAVQRIGGIVAILLAADAPVPDPAYSGGKHVAACAVRAARIHAIAPALAIVGWCWCHAHGADADHPEISRYAAAGPLGLDDPDARSWAAMEAAQTTGASWAMPLLAACGAAS